MKFIKSTTLNTSNNVLLDENWIAVFNSQQKSYKTKKLCLEVLLGVFYAFGLGYSLFFLDNLLKVGILFVVSFIILCVLIIIPHEFIHLIFLKSKENIVIKYNYIKLMFIANSDGPITKSRAIVMLLTPFILFTIVPTILVNILGFNMFLYVLATVNAIKSARDLINVLLISKEVPKSSGLRIYDYDFYYKDSGITNNL